MKETYMRTKMYAKLHVNTFMFNLIITPISIQADAYF